MIEVSHSVPNRTDGPKRELRGNPSAIVKSNMPNPSQSSTPTSFQQTLITFHQIQNILVLVQCCMSLRSRSFFLKFSLLLFTFFQVGEEGRRQTQKNKLVSSLGRGYYPLPKPQTSLGFGKRLIHQFENHLNRDSSMEDLNKTEQFNPFSAKSKDLITDMGNTEIFEICETSSKIQCPDCVFFFFS